MSAAVLLASAPGSRADDRAATPAWREIWAGAEVATHAWSVHTGTTLAPFSAVAADGLRVRTVGGYGRYRYTRETGGARRVDGETAFTDLLLGYQMGLGPATVKAFGGIALVNHALDALDPGNPVQGLDAGFKGALEVWLNLSATSFLSSDLAWTAAHASYSARARLGTALFAALPSLSVGPEVGAAGNAAYDGGRAGGFVRYAWDGGEVSLAGGVLGTIEKADSPYASVNVLFKY